MKKKLLHIDSSPRKERSHSRSLSLLFREKWLDNFPEFDLMYRDLYVTPPPHVDENWIAAAFTPPTKRTIHHTQALEISDHLVDQFFEADYYLLGVPMYNFGMPSILKAYIDNIIRVNRTFLFTPEDKEAPYKPLVKGKKMFVVVATGDHGYQKGEILEPMNHLEPHLRTAFGFIGVEDIRFIYSGNDEFGGERLEKSIQQAIHKMEDEVCSFV
ncbi:NAD(P)H-dependent oxidoreductase [Rapidithrix thailandica]|uniref:FMN dependent NADH:quinone oxidoreductase n=1 Tax=Rapidithrix thailandica TaxID=413964 RepID=A0AAW9SC09_9BACT